MRGFLVGIIIAPYVVTTYYVIFRHCKGTNLLLLYFCSIWFLFVLEFSVLEFKSLGMRKLYFCNVLTMNLWKLECGLCCWNFLSYSKFL